MGILSIILKDLRNVRSSFYIHIIFLLLFSEFVFGWIIVQQVPYTEIDWKAYMEEVGEPDGFLGGERDYTKMKGGTGPLVYPAGFVWLYSLLYRTTDGGINIELAQYIFLGLYLLITFLVLQIYKQTRQMPLWTIILICVSKRIHSIFMLRLFNDGCAMIMLYLAVYLFIKNRWSLGCVFYSLAVSIKMNVFLFAPSLLILLLKRFHIKKTVMNLAICAFIQVGVGWPFLSTYPISYFRRAFNFGKQFEYKWSINMQMFDEETFLGAPLALVSIGLHLSTLILFANRIWCRDEGGILGVLKKGNEEHVIRDKNLCPEHIVSVLFSGNFIGIVFSKSLHYQFYVWYFHTIPYLLWRTDLPSVIRIIIFVCIEVVWNMYPPRILMSVTLWICHLVLLLGLWLGRLMTDRKGVE